MWSDGTKSERAIRLRSGLGMAGNRFPKGETTGAPMRLGPTAYMIKRPSLRLLCAGANPLKFVKRAPIFFHYVSTALALRFDADLPFGSGCGACDRPPRDGPEGEAGSR